MANFSIDINLPANHTTKNTNLIPCTMNSTLVQLDNRPIQTSTPITQMTVKQSGNKSAHFTSRTFNQQTPVIKNPNRNRKVKDLIVDLRMQQQQNNNIQINQEQTQPQQQAVVPQQIQQAQFQPQQQSFQDQVYSPQQFQSIHDSNLNYSQFNNTNASNNNNQSHYLIDNNDSYLISNNSKLITLNSLNNEADSISNNTNTNLDFNNQNHQNFNNYMLNDGAGNVTQHLTVSNNLNDCAGSFIPINHNEMNTHNQQFGDSYNQQQIILDNAVEVENNNEEYLIFNLLNKIANTSNTEKLISTMSNSDDDQLEKANIHKEPMKLNEVQTKLEASEPSYATLTSIYTSNKLNEQQQSNNNGSNAPNNLLPIKASTNTHISPNNNSASSSCSPSSSSPPSSAASSTTTTTLFQLSNLKKEKIDDYLPINCSIIKNQSETLNNGQLINTTDSEHGTSSSSSSCCSSSSNSSLNSNMMLMMMNNNNSSFNNTSSNNNNKNCKNQPSLIDVDTNASGLTINTMELQNPNHQYTSLDQNQTVIQQQYQQVMHNQQQELMQPTQECRVEVLSPTNAQMEEINTKELAHRVSSELKRYSIPQAVFAQRVLCRSQGTLSDLLRNPKPWSKLKSGRETFRRMYKWLQEPESQRMNSLRIAAASKRKEDDEECLNNSVNTEKTNEYQINGIEEPSAESEKEGDEESEGTESESDDRFINESKRNIIWNTNSANGPDSFNNYEIYNQRIDSQEQQAQQQMLPSASTLLSLSTNDSPQSLHITTADMYETFTNQSDNQNYINQMNSQGLSLLQSHNQMELLDQSFNHDYSCTSQPPSKKPRLVFTDIQRRTLQAIFKETRRPSKEMQVTIAQQLGLEVNTVSNFFMNARRRSMDKWKDQCDDDDNSNCSSMSK